MLRRHQGRSVWLDLERALTLARELPWLGTHVSEIRPPESIILGPFSNDPHHATAYGPTEDLYDNVVRILPAR